MNDVRPIPPETLDLEEMRRALPFVTGVVAMSGDEAAYLLKSIEYLEAENERLRAIVSRMSHRRCHECGHEDFYLLPSRPHCDCANCGSPDTRLIRAPAAAEAAKEADDGVHRSH